MPHYSRMRRLYASIALSTPMFFSANAFAQSAVEGAIGGTITDSAGAVIPQAQVSVVNNGTNQSFEQTTDTSGFFRFPHLQTGIYMVTVTAPGFAELKDDKVTVAVSRVTDFNKHLSVGSTSQTVSVSAAAPVLNTSSPDIGSEINATDINNLPINGRRWSNFALLTPGVTPSGGFGLLSFRGISGLLNNNTVDGADNNQAFFSEERGRTRLAYSTTEESVQEFQVQTSNYSAQYGRAAGGVINTVTKSGTNQFHGGAFWYYRDNDFGATNPFALQSVLQPGSSVPTQIHIKPKDKRHQFGGSLGGPLLHDKLFFFYAFDRQLHNFPGVSAPSPLFFGELDNIKNGNCVDPANKKNTVTYRTCLHNRGISDTQISAGVAYLNSLIGIVPRTGDQSISFPKLDWQINAANRASFSYNRMRWDSPAGIQTGAVSNRSIDGFGNDFAKIDTGIVRLDTQFSPKLSNEARYEYGRDFEYEFSQPPAPGEPTTGPGGLPPQIAIGNGGITFGTPNFLQRQAYPDEREQDVADNMTLVKGNQTLTFGIDYRHVNDLSNNLFGGFGQYSFNNLADWITDFTYNSGHCDGARDAGLGAFPCYNTFTQGFGQAAFVFNTNEYAGYVQDDWKALPSLTLNLGVRYEYEQLPKPQLPNPALPLTASFPNDGNNVGPRFGFAYDFGAAGKTVLRGGYGIYFGRIINSTIYNALSVTGAPGAQYSVPITPTTSNKGVFSRNATAPAYPGTFTGTVTTNRPQTVVQFASNAQNPLVQEAQLTLEHNVGWNTVLSAHYLLSLGQHLPNFVDQNIAPATSNVTYTVSGGRYDGRQFTVPLYTTRVNPNFAAVTSVLTNINSNYHALVLEANHRFEHNLQFLLNYTFSKALDYNQNTATFTDTNDQTDPFNINPDYGISSLNIPHRFVGSLVWQPTVTTGNRLTGLLANGWTVAPIVTLQSGAPYAWNISGSSGAGLPNTSSTSINGSGGTNYLPFVGRNSQKITRLENVDLRISRGLVFAEKYRVEALGEAFNLFNRENFNAVNTTAYNASGTTLTYQGAFGVPNSAGNGLYRERQLQLALKFSF